MLTLLTGPVLALRHVPVARAVINPENAVLGVVVQLDGRQSEDDSALPSRHGSDASTTGPDLVMSGSADFTQDDLGRYLSLGDDEFFVSEIVSSSQVRVLNKDGSGPSLGGGSNLSWSLFDRLSYEWSFVSTPIGSAVRQESFRLLESDASLVSFSPDIVGEYVVQLSVSNGTYESEPTQVQTSVRAILVPHGRGIVPDGKFIWTYVRDVWAQVEGKEWFETLWSALIQIAGSELLKLYQNDFAKSIRDIQDRYQRRWLSYEPKLVLPEDLSFFLGLHRAGDDAATIPGGIDGSVVLLPTEDSPTTWTASASHAVGDVVSPTGASAAAGSYFRCKVAGSSGSTEPSWRVAFNEQTVDGTAVWALTSLTKELVLVQGSLLPNVTGERLSITYDTKQPKNVRSYTLQGTSNTKTGYVLAASDPPPDPLPGRIAFGVDAQFQFQTDVWTVSGTVDVRVGDVFHFPSGPNAGFYSVEMVTGSEVIVSETPKSFSDATTVLTYKPNLYRPVGFKLEVEVPELTDTISMPYYPDNHRIEGIAPGRIITAGGQAHTILRTAADHRRATPALLVVTDRSFALSGLSGLKWRTPHTVVSRGTDFEAAGVSSGDLLVITVTDLDSLNSVDVKAQVVGVDRNRFGFVLTDEQVVGGQVPPIPTQTIVSAAEALRIGSVVQRAFGDVTYGDELADLIRQINSSLFQRDNANVALTPESRIVVGKRAFSLRPKFVIRNRVIPVPEDLRSVPLLQQWIVQPQLGQRGDSFFQVKNGKEFPLDRPPISLTENTHYLIDGELAFSGEMSITTGTDIVFSETGDFVARNVVPGNVFSISAPESLVGDYKIIKALDNERLLLARPIPADPLGPTIRAKVRILRNGSSNSLRFVPGLFTAKLPAPDRLWAEVSFFDNNETIEDNFGILVGLTRRDLEDISESVNYRQAVAGLMFALTKGSALEKVRLGAQILLGLPFAEHRGIIRAIDGDYRLDSSGTPIQGRMLVEDVDSNGVSEGTQRVYTFTLDTESSLSGVDTNPATKKPYVVGDIVELFAPLAKGVEITDYLTNPGSDLSTISQIQQFHVFRMRANDSIFTYKELGLVSPFLRKITPAYVAFIITTTTEIVDEVSVQDKVTVSVRSAGTLIDNPYFGLDTAMAFDAKSSSGIRILRWDEDFFTVRKSGRDLVSTALVGSPGSDQTLTLPSGGLVNPSFGPGPVTRAGRDLLLIVDGANQGLYPITAVTDGSIEVSGAPTYGFQPSTTNRFAVVRGASGDLARGTLSRPGGVGPCLVAPGLVADGAYPGNLLVVDHGGGICSRHILSRIGPHPDSPALVDGEVETVPGVAAVTGRPYAVFNTILMGSPFETVTSPPTTLISNGTQYTSFGDTLLLGALEPKDELEVEDGAIPRLFALDPARLVFTPVLPAGSYSVRICKRGQPASAVGFDHLAHGPVDRVEVGLSGDSAATNSGSDTVAFAEIPNPALSNIRPGDMLWLEAGSDSTVDVGYGPGRYPIVDVTASDVRLSTALAGTGTVAWQVIRSA